MCQSLNDCASHTIVSNSTALDEVGGGMVGASFVLSTWAAAEEASSQLPIDVRMSAAGGASSPSPIVGRKAVVEGAVLFGTVRNC